MSDKEFIERLTDELNKLKDKINPTCGIPFFFNERTIQINKIETSLCLSLEFGITPIILLKLFYKKYNEEIKETLYKEFIEALLKYILFFKDFEGKDIHGKSKTVKSIQTIIKTIKVYGE